MRGNTDIELRYERSMLYDFYGALLTSHQQCIYEDAVMNDMSLTEIAQDYDISRQAVSDLLKRINKLLDGYEEKLHLVAKFTRAKGKVEQIRSIAEMPSDDVSGSIKEIEQIAGSILEDF